MANLFGNLHEESTFECLTDIPQQKVLNKLTPSDYMNMQLVSFFWWKMITPMFNKPCHILLTDTEKDILKYVANCTRTWINSLTVTNCTIPLPIHSSTRTEFATTKKLILKKGISEENLLKLLRYYVNKSCQTLFISGNSLGALKLQHINGLHFRNLTEFLFDFYELNSERHHRRLRRLRRQHYVPPLACWYNNEHLPKYITERNCQHILALIKLFEEMRIPNLKKVGGRFPFGYQNAIWKSLHLSFGKFMQRHSQNIESVSMKIQGPLRWMVPFLEDELKHLANLTELNLEFSFVTPPYYYYYSSIQPSFKCQNGIRLLQLLRGFPKLKHLSSNLRSNSTRRIDGFVINFREQRGVDLVHKLVFQRYARQLETFEFTPNKFNWLRKCDLNFPKLNKLTCEHLKFGSVFATNARRKNFILPSLKHLALKQTGVLFYTWNKCGAKLTQGCINWIGLIAPILESLESDCFQYQYYRRRDPIDHLSVKKIVVGLPKLQNLIFSFKLSPDFPKVGLKVDEDATGPKIKKLVRWCNRNNGISQKFYEVPQKRTNSARFFEFSIEIYRR